MNERAKLLQEQIECLKEQLMKETFLDGRIFVPEKGSVFYRLGMNVEPIVYENTRTADISIEVGNCFVDRTDAELALERFECMCTRPVLKDGKTYYSISIIGLSKVDIASYDFEKDDECVIDDTWISIHSDDDSNYYLTGLYGRTREEAIERAKKYGPAFMKVLAELS